MKSKICTFCRMNKSLENFYVDVRGLHGRFSKCKKCIKSISQGNKTRKKEYDSCRRQKQLEKIREYDRVRYNRDKPKRLALAKLWMFNNKEKRKKIVKEWNQRNKEKVVFYVRKRQMAKINASPKWLTAQHHEQILEMYKKAKELTEITGKKHHVDHIIPLRHPDICGLHVSWNLQVLEASENIRKSNKLTIFQEDDTILEDEAEIR